MLLSQGSVNGIASRYAYGNDFLWHSKTHGTLTSITQVEDYHGSSGGSMYAIFRFSDGWSFTVPISSYGSD